MAAGERDQRSASPFSRLQIAVPEFELLQVEKYLETSKKNADKLGLNYDWGGVEGKSGEKPFDTDMRLALDLLCFGTLTKQPAQRWADELNGIREITNLRARVGQHLR